MKTQAAILCGGRGERLKPLSDYFQKVMIPIGPKKLPLLAYIIALMRHHGVKDITLLTGYRSEDIMRYFGDGSAHGVKITYSDDPKGLPGSLNAVANALRNGAIPACDQLLVYYGDMLTDLPVAGLLDFHRKQNLDVTLVLGRRYALPVGVADVKDGLVVSFREKPSLELSVSTGMMVASRKGMASITEVASSRSTDLMTHFVPAILKQGAKVGAFYNDNEWFDVGTVSSFERLDREIGKHPVNAYV